MNSQVWKFLKYFGHGDLPASDLAGLLSECGYKGNELRDILTKAAETKTPSPRHNRDTLPAEAHSVASEFSTRTPSLRHHNSILVRTVAQTIEDRPGLKRLLPERTLSISCALLCPTIICLGFFASMGQPPPAMPARHLCF